MLQQRILPIAAILLLALSGVAWAQGEGDDPARADTIAWTASAPGGAVVPGSRLVLTLQGRVLDGWHVYGLKQLPNGPTPLLVTLAGNDEAVAAGAATASAPVKFHDPSFGLQTEYYDHPFTVSLPVRIGAHAGGGAHTLALNVRFQTCNGRICQPPKSQQISVPVTIGGG